jgi:putative flippase GtrA
MYLGVLFKFIKFGAVGASGMVVDFGTTYVLKEKVKIQKYWANSIGFLLAASTNYILNRFWTFRSHNPHYIEEFIKFFIVSLIGLAFSNLFIWLFHQKGKLNFYLAKFFAVGVTMLWNFGANFLYTFV